jgi:hypothetical protein
MRIRILWSIWWIMSLGRMGGRGRGEEVSWCILFAKAYCIYGWKLS